MILLLFFAVIAVAEAVRLSVVSIRRRRMAAEVRGDWWPKFEREFHAYASKGWRSARDTERQD